MLETLLTNAVAWTGAVGSVILLLVGYFARKYLVPLLRVAKHQKYAKWIAGIADEVTDDLRARYPDNEWLVHLDEAIDKIIEVCDISPQIARRAAQAAVTRKK